MREDLAGAIPERRTYILVLFDGLGTHQLRHPAASIFRDHLKGSLDAGFPTTTTVNLATIATGQPPATHGIIAHLMWFADLRLVVNTLKWVTLSGAHVPYPTERLLPVPNLWERLAGAGVEPITVQQADFVTTPLTRALYRGCRFERFSSWQEAADASVEMAAGNGRRLIFTYLNQVDYAGHVFGQNSPKFGAALESAATVWASIRQRLPANAGLVGTADHGLLDYPESAKRLIRSPGYRSLTFFGDPRGVMVNGDPIAIRALAKETGATLHTDISGWLGSGSPHPDLASRLPEALLLAPEGRVLLPPGFDKRLRGYHGGLAEAERRIPLLVG
jgi:hypothetical protein